ncbi:putative mitochondrial 2-oxoglutarate/malate carrier protein [Cyphellophora attinorum]|uniref:Putative mitochondrial 2-oxoglutarate/malate carrier protein n=1 Tax=Cyphellophora attinorum TaxID=1664694 RepID=A0A0N1HD44_9EURO|nr:putative mitochondrial 2-oxoglutarate/malate carrier protein [Phialophora attinorum]KPI42117.1 putative mitochondrial 2-oxoglutarate/malate carrier protein [Phialophora attinorum]
MARSVEGAGVEQSPVLAAKNGRVPLSEKFWQGCIPFVIGGVSGMAATICVQPLDMVKVRMQLTTSDKSTGQGSVSAINVLRGIVRSGGAIELYNGLSAALARQLVYGTTRLGLFATFEQNLRRRAEISQHSYSFTQRALASVSAGGIAAAVGNPIEVALIRMQSDGMHPVNRQQKYRSAVDALIRIVKTEGVAVLWSGCGPTVVRAMSTNFGQLACFSETKHQLKVRTSLSDWQQTLLASANGGFCAALFSMPFDTVKSRLQSRQARYRGMAHCFSSILKEEGALRFYRGFPMYCARLGPHS